MKGTFLPFNCVWHVFSQAATSLNFVYGIFFIQKFTISLMAEIYFEMPQTSDGTEVGKGHRWTDRYMVQERNTFTAELGLGFSCKVLSALLNV